MVHIIVVRQKYTISTFPPELTWPPLPNTILECANCMVYGCYRGVLIGPCRNCADEYEGQYGVGLFLNARETDQMGDSDDWQPLAFGQLHPDRVKSMIDQSLGPTGYAINSGMYDRHDLDLFPCCIARRDAYSVYNLAALTTAFERDLLKVDDLIGAGYTGFDAETLGSFLSAVAALALQYNDYTTRTFFYACKRLEQYYKEEFFMRAQAAAAAAAKNAADARCTYCQQPSKAKCSRCRRVRYCSYACQQRDWVITHRDECEYL